MAVGRFASGLLNARMGVVKGWRWLAILVVIGVIIGLVGPYGSYVGMTLPVRVAHFVFCVTVIGGMSVLVSRLVSDNLFGSSMPLWAGVLIDLALMLPSALMVFTSIAVLSPNVLSHVRLVDLMWQTFVAALITRGFLVWRYAAFSARAELALGQGAPEPVAANIKEAEDQTIEPHSFLQRLPLGLRASAILVASAEDHYLRLYYATGDVLVLATLSEAAQALPDGFQIHRSHWVRRAAITSHSASEVRTSNGLLLPLSRYRRADFGAWFNAGAPASQAPLIKAS